MLLMLQVHLHLQAHAAAAAAADGLVHHLLQPAVIVLQVSIISHAMHLQRLLRV